MQPLLLHTAHSERGAQLDELRGRELVLSFGDVDAEYRAGREGAALVDLSFREGLRVIGPDSESFLQGMVTQDVKAIPALGAAYAVMLSAKGAMVSDARVLREEADAFSLDVEPGYGEPVLAFLGKFLISEDAELTMDTERALLSLVGPRALELLRRASPALPETWTQGQGARTTVAGVPVHVLAWSRVGVPGFELLVPREGFERVYLELAGLEGVRPAGFEAMERLRVEAGLPRHGQDTIETTIPLEARLESAISYTKGCYIGQEVIARATYRGHMNRHLCRLELGAEEAAVGAQLHVGEKRVGWLTSVVRSPALGNDFLALGYIHRDHQAPGTLLRVDGRDAPVSVAADVLTGR